MNHLNLSFENVSKWLSKVNNDFKIWNGGSTRKHQINDGINMDKGDQLQFLPSEKLKPQADNERVSLVNL